MPLDEFNQAKDLIIEDPPGALEAFNKIIKEYPGSEYAAEAQVLIGKVYKLKFKDYKKAFEAWNKVIELYPNKRGVTIPSIDGWAKSCIETIFYDIPNDTLRELIIKYEKSPLAERAHIQLANNLYHQIKFWEALLEYKDFVKKYPNSEFTGEAENFIKEYSELQIKENAITSKGEQNAEDLFNLATLYYDFLYEFPIQLEAGIDLDPAFDIFRELIDRFPNSIFTDKAEYYILQHRITGSFEDANSVDVPIVVKECEEFIKKYPESELAAEIQYNIGEYLNFYVYNDYPYFKVNLFLENMELMTLRYPWKIFGTEPTRYLELSKQAYEKCAKDYPESEYAKKAIEKIKETEMEISEVKDSLNSHPKTEIEGKVSYDEKVGAWILVENKDKGYLKYLLAGEQVSSVSDYNFKEVKVSGLLSPRIYGDGSSDWYVFYLTSIDWKK